LLATITFSSSILPLSHAFRREGECRVPPSADAFMPSQNGTVSNESAIPFMASRLLQHLN